MNKVFLIGRLARDPEVKYTQDNKAVARMTVCVDRKYKSEGQQDADFITCVSFGKTAEFIEKYFSKGMKIVIEGRWQTGSYTNRDGQKVYTNDCVVENVEFGESKKSQGGNSAPEGADDFMNIPDDISDECPFGDLPT